MFLKVEPLNTAWAESNLNWGDNLIFSERTEKFQDRDAAFPNFRNTNNDATWGYGCLYIAGGSGFGYGEFDKYKGWNARWKPAGADDNYVLADNQMWIPSPEKNLYKFRLQAGGNLPHTAAHESFDVKFYLNNYLKKKKASAIGDNWDDYDLQNSWRGGNVATDKGYSDTDYPYLLHQDDSRDCFYVSLNKSEGSSPSESADSPDWKNGNFKTTTIGFDSSTPGIPEGYTFEITMDLRDLEENPNSDPVNWKEHNRVNGVEVTIEQIKDEYTLNYVNLDLTTYKDNNSLTNEGIKYVETNGATKAEVYLSKYNKNEVDKSDRNVTERIKLRDALRFDYGIPFSRQYTTKEEELGNVVKFEELIIHGYLCDEDLQYISWLAKHGKLVKLDLSDAILPDGIIPGPQKIDAETELTSFGGWDEGKNGESNVLKEVIVPKGGVNGVGRNAFKGCKNLTNMGDIVKAVNGAIGKSAFEGCDNSATAEIDLQGVTYIGENAFKDCTQLKKITVPANVAYPYSFNGTGDKLPSNVGSAFKDVTVNGETKIEAEDFNSGNGGYNHAEKTGEGSSNYRGDANSNYGIKNNGTYSNSHDIGYNTQGDWYCYTFKVEADGYYKLTSHIGSGDKADRKITATFDGHIDGIDFVLPADQQTAGVWDGSCIKEISSDKILFFKAGYHYMKIEVTGPNGIELDCYTLNPVGSGQTENINTNTTNAPYANSFEGITPNNCEVVFTGDDNSSNWQKYRDGSQKGWMYLLTKDLDEKQAYFCVNQAHADAKHTHTFKANAWYSIVLPFEVDAKILSSVKGIDGNQAFDWAARYKYVDFSGKYTDSEGNVTSGLPKAHFIYLDDAPLLVNASGIEKIRAGEPFLIHCASTVTDNVYLFENVNTLCSKTGDIADEKAMTKTNGDIDFIGNLYLTPRQLGESEYFISEYYYHSNNARLKPYRAWLAPKTEQAAKGLAFLFGNGLDNDDFTTGITIVNAGNIIGNDGVYNLNGQKVRQGNASMENLPKGVYVVNGKRVVVK